MLDECKTTVISFSKDTTTAKPNLAEQTSNSEDTPIANVLYNRTTKVPHVEESLPTINIPTIKNGTKKIDPRTVEQINTKARFLPSFYKKELKRYFRVLLLWIFLTLACIGLETWCAVLIIKNPGVNNWTLLTLIPALTLCIAFLVVYANNYRNYRNEAKSVDFSQEKPVTINVSKLYKRLKTGHINVNWMCSLTYVAGGLAILITYIVAWVWTGCVEHQLPINQWVWGNLSPSLFANTCGPAFLISLIVCCAAILTAFILHVVLLVTNYTRAGKIDAFYGVQIVSDDELIQLKKHKNKRDAIIFIAVILCVVLIGLLIYKIVKSKQVNNTVTINSK